MYFRGIASGGDEQAIHAGPLPSTGLYLDEIPETTIGSSLDLHVYDIQRVEALAGPQGTLYGSSSLSGTMRIITNKPDPTSFAAGYDIKGDKYGKGTGGDEFEGFVNIPLTENAAVRLVGYYEHDGGYIDNVLASRTYSLQAAAGSGFADAPLTITNAAYAGNNLNQIDTYGGRAALKVDLNERWTVTPMLVYQHQQSNGLFSYDPQVGDLAVTDFRPDYTNDHWYQAALTIEGKINNYDLVYAGGYLDRNTANANDYSEYSVAYDYNGYSRFRDNAGKLIDPSQKQLQTDRYTKITHEIRLSSPDSDPVRFVVGAFYQSQTDNFREAYLINNLGNNAQYNFSVTGQLDTLYLSQMERVDRDYAAFGDVTWDITQQLKISAGIRGFVARNTLNGFFGFNNLYSDTSNGDNFVRSSGESSCFNPPATGSNAPCQNTDKGIREDGETHRINLTFQLDPNRMIYATYSTGFRPGGNNRRVGVPAYNSDTLSNYEIGWKTAWFDKRLRFNGAVFYEQWKGVQLGIIGLEGITDIRNIGNAAVKGLESDITWLAFDNLDFSFAGSYVNARTTTEFCGENATNTGVLASCTNPEAPAGSRLPITPEFKANATARYTFLVAQYNSFVQAAVVHQSSANSDLRGAIEAEQGPAPAFTTADFSVGTGASNWNVQLFIQNAFDERGQIIRYGQCSALNGYCYQHPRVYPIKPQLFGIKFGQKF